MGIRDLCGTITYPLLMKTVFPATLLLLLFAQRTFSQSADSTRHVGHLAGGVTLTNNGISLLPTFMLNKPAVLFDLSVGKGRWSFDPQLRFSMEGKPWTFVFWGRYQALKTSRFLLSVGAHPAVAFFNTPAPDGSSAGTLVARRALAGEVVPTYLLSKHTNVGLYYLGAHGLDPGLAKATHFVALRAGFTKIPLTKTVFLQAGPQLYYLNMDGVDGVYVTSTFMLAKKDFPLSLQSIVNKTIRTRIPSRDFIWNVSLIYAFNRKITGI